MTMKQDDEHQITRVIPDTLKAAHTRGFPLFLPKAKSVHTSLKTQML